MNISPGNLKLLLAEWEKVREEQDKASSGIPEFESDGSGKNPKFVKARDAVYSDYSKDLLPLADELDAQEDNAMNSQDLNDRAKFEALRRMLSGSSK